MARNEWPFGGLRSLAGYEVIVANPPLPFELYSEKGESKSYQRTHGAMALPEIKALPVGHLARDPCVLLLSTTAPMLDVSLSILAAWGFVFKSELVCRKLTTRGKPHRGTGYRVRSMHRTFLFGTVGNPKHKKFDSHFDGRVRPNGAIPHELYELAARCCPNTFKLDLFADGPRAGWDSWALQPGQIEPVVHTAQELPAEEGPLLRLARAAA